MRFGIYPGFFVTRFLGAFGVYKDTEISEGGYNMQHFKFN